MIIAVGSTNAAKVLAVKELLLNYSFLSKAEIVALSTHSGVSNQPLSLQETIQGAKNRAQNAFNDCDACTYSFGIESGLMEAPVSSGFLHTCVCCIYDGTYDYIGLSTSFEVPSQVLELIMEKKLDLAQACLQAGISHNPQIGSEEGLIGVLTKGRVNRKEFCKQCIMAAMVQLENAEWYTSKQNTSVSHLSSN